MTNLGLDALTDDQLVDLAQAIALEMANRSPAVVDAAKAAIAAATARVTQDQDAIWAAKAWLGRMVTCHLGSGWTLNVWRATNQDETRVYLENPGGDRRRRDALKYCLYVTGGTKFAPDTLTVEAGSQAEAKDAGLVKIICKHAAQAFIDGLRLDCDYAANLKYASPAHPQDLLDRVAVLNAQKEHAERRKVYHDTLIYTKMAPVREAEAAVAAKLGVESFHQVNMSTPEWKEVTEARKAVRSEIDALMTAWDNENEAPK
ncbi:hypothetical protein ACEYYA_02385 [Paracoccus sp. p3-h83]|uniref:hypothetical protein n=1 Tax=Paracoccus sp. p3-h83 TaxID=3342805 RepID=UPI0035B8AA30